MHPSKPSIIGALIVSARSIVADSYANNQNSFVVDAPQVAANFHDVEDIELLSPAFINPTSVPGTFPNGTSGPTPHYSLGSHVVS